MGEQIRLSANRPTNFSIQLRWEFHSAKVD